MGPEERRHDQGRTLKTEEGDEGNLPTVAIRMDEDKILEELTEGANRVIPRNFYIQARDLEAHGYSAGCPGCVSILKRAKNRRPHSEACRRRLEELLKDTDKVKAADERKTEAINKMFGEGRRGTQGQANQG